jgi:hypothetical protein
MEYTEIGSEKKREREKRKETAKQRKEIPNFCAYIKEGTSRSVISERLVLAVRLTIY